MDRLEAMAIFGRVAELSSFSGAARALSLSSAKVSAAVSQLEQELGVRLLYRTTRQVRLTPEGEQVYRRGKALLSQMEALSELFSAQGELSGRLRVDMPLSLAQRVVLPRLPDFLALHPRLEVEFSCTDRRVEMVEEGFDCVMRVGTLHDASHMVRHVGRYEVLNCVSQDYAARHGVPRTLEDLSEHFLVYYTQRLGEAPDGFEYVALEPPHEVRQVAMRGKITVNNSLAYMGACMAGLGIVQVPRMGRAGELARGELVEVLPEYRAAPMPISLIYPAREYLPERVRVFMDWLTGLMKEEERRERGEGDAPADQERRPL